MNSIITILILILVIFQYIAERKVESYEKIYNKFGKKLKLEINNIKRQLLIIDINEYDTYKSILLKIENNKQSNHKYILVKKEEFILSNKVLKLILSNYLYVDKNICGFNTKLIYDYGDNKKLAVREVLNDFYITSLNYIDIFNKKDLLSFGVTISKLENEIYKNKGKAKIISYISNDVMAIKLGSDKTKIITKNIKGYYKNKVSKANIFSIFKILIFILYGTIITGNMIYSTLNIRTDFFGFIISLIIYFCYVYIIRYIYKSIGKYKMIAKYMFPFYIISYIFVIIIVLIKEVIHRIKHT